MFSHNKGQVILGACADKAKKMGGSVVVNLLFFVFEAKLIKILKDFHVIFTRCKANMGELFQ